MKKDLYLLGSTGSIGNSTLKLIRKDKKNFSIKLLTTNTNVKKILKQALEFNVKKIVIFNKKKFYKFEKSFKRNKISVYFSIEDALKKNKRKSFLTINAISGIDGLEPSINIIKYTRNLAIANKESIICGWKFLNRELTQNNTNFIPLDSEHFSIWSLLKNDNIKNVKKIYLTASGGPFLNKKLENIKYIKPKFALRHPNWKMGKKISIDSATMMNKIFEVIEAVKIFNLSKNKFQILIHPKSYIHAIVHFNSGLTKMLAHKTSMEIPIANVINLNKYNFIINKNEFDYVKLNGLNFITPDQKNFPLLKILNYEFNNTFFEIILVAINDELVRYYLNNQISYISIHKIMLKLLKKRYLAKFFNTSPKNINEIKLMVNKVNLYLKKYI
jgi:1-deoxy-D-xylulose-5-phosphate reductoisomerase